MKRKHQLDMELAVDNIISGEAKGNTIVANVTPGGGKSTLPIIAGRLIQQGLADGICWTVPRQSLQDQGERSFLDPFFRNLFKHNLTIRSSTNEINPCRDQHGFITTYQAIGENNTSVYQSFKSRRMIMILDEFHHVEKGGLWHKALDPIMELTAYKLLMTGTLERGNESQIAFIDYKKESKGSMPYFGKDTQLIEYTRADALKEQAILPIKFHVFDGSVAWKDKKGAQFSGKLSDFAYGTKASGALYTALNTDFALEILNESINHWRMWNQGREQWSKLLVVTSDREQAEKITTYIRRTLKLTAQLATSHDSASAQENIKNFKFSTDLNVLVTIAMAYEGMDCPPVSHIASLTNIRSTPWIEQMIARAVRIWGPWGPYNTQVAHIFCPDDWAMKAVIAQIQAEQGAVAKGKAEKEEEEEQGEPTEEGYRVSPYEALSGSIDSSREIDLGEGMEGFNTPAHEPIKTIKEIETELRQRIHKYICRYALSNFYEPQRINYEVSQAFMIPRADMTLQQLKTVYSYIQTHYPVSMQGSTYQGDGSKPRKHKRRLPTKAVAWNKQQKLF